MTTHITRRNLLATLGTAAGAALVAPAWAFAQARQGAPPSAPTVISNPPRDFGPGGPPTTYFNDPDVLTIDPSFNALVQPNTSLARLWTGALWTEGPAWSGEVYAFDVGLDNKVSNRTLFTDCMIDEVKCGPDGLRCDVGGNIWMSSNAGRALGYSGVTVWNPGGKLLGRIRLPEVCGNLTFGGPKRNRLFMAASQSIYTLYVATQGAAPA